MKGQRLYIQITIISFLILISCQNEKKIDKDNHKQKTTLALKKSPSAQEEKDWQEVKNKVLTGYGTPEERYKYDNGNFWDKLIFEENAHKSKRQVILNFLRKYPDSKHHFDALKYYFSYLVEPRFIDSPLEKDKQPILMRDMEKIVNEDKSKLYKRMRTLPFDKKSRDDWFHEGDSLVQNFLKSAASTDQKARIEAAKLGRDKRMARYLYEFLKPDKAKEEAEYWLLFDNYFWKDFIERMDRLIFKYPKYSKWPHNVDLFIKGVTLHFLSPELEESLWQHFYEVTNQPKMFEKYPVIAETHKKAKENLKALEDLKTFDETQPLQMQMIGIDGKKINLEDYRGKVVMLDFWDLRCAPCIKEMPHVQSLYEKYKDQGFEVIGICAASNEGKERIQKITGKQGATWPQVLDRASDAIISYHSLYNIERLPTVWLLNKDGAIVDKHARGNRLEPLIKKHLKLN